MGMDQMFADMASKMIDKYITPETKAWITENVTKENMEKVVNNSKAFVEHINSSLQRIIDKQVELECLIESHIAVSRQIKESLDGHSGDSGGRNSSRKHTGSSSARKSKSD